MDRTTKEEFIFGSILLLANKLQIWGDGKLSDLTLKQWFLLLLISKMDTSNPTVTAISDFTGTSRQNVRKMLESLEKKEYVKMQKSDTDGRSLNVTLTEKTFQYFIDFEQKGAELVNELFSSVSIEDLDASCRTMQTLLDIIEN